MLNEAKKNKIYLILLGITPLIGMGVDLVSPSLPHIARELHVSHIYAKNLISIYLILYAIRNMISGCVAMIISFFYQIPASYFLAYVLLMLMAIGCYRWIIKD